jgi:hypothetical protein
MPRLRLPLTTAASAWVQGTVRGHPGAVMDLPSPENENLGLKKTSRAGITNLYDPLDHEPQRFGEMTSLRHPSV